MRMGCGALISALLPFAACAEELPDWQHLRPAKQQGPSCAFFANIPALSLATGIDIAESDAFIRSVYGLRRGDFEFQRSFDKRIFCELFALPWETTTVEHPELPYKELPSLVRQVIHQRLDPGLAKGWVYSLRVNGIHGGPHNVLLLAKGESGYVVHNPSPGWIRELSAAKLATLMLVRSTSEENRLKPVYITQYMTIPLERSLVVAPQSLAAIPAELSIAMEPPQRAELQRKLGPAGGVPAAGKSMPEWIRRYPGVDFAVLQRDDETEPRNVIGSTLKPEDLKGLLHLSRFHLAIWQMKRRPLLPVVFMDGEPWILAGYRAPVEQQPSAPVLAFDNGREQRWMNRQDALDRIHADGALFGTVELKPDLTQ